ncbi:MAG TPA: hypothetical protein VN364_09365 [Bellilinea sp.]|nr:hypothetical protein [Bellilinea sp.]
MLPGPFQMPLPSLPFYIHPVLLWAIVLVAAVGLAVTFFKFIFSDSIDRTSNFMVFFLVAVIIALVYFGAMNWPRISAWLRSF